MARSNQGYTMIWNTYTPQPMSLPRINILHLTVFEVHGLDRIFKLKVITARSKGFKLFRPCQMPWVKIIPAKPFKAVR